VLTTSKGRDIVNSAKTLRRSSNRTVTALALLVGVVGSGFASIQTSAAAPVSLSINRGDQQAVANAFNQVFAPAKSVAAGWTGDASSCVPGSISVQAKDATFTAINYFRAMAGVKAVPENAAASQRAQAVATVMAANRGLSHNPSSAWGAGFACAGIYPARQSDEGEILRQGITGAQAVESFIDGAADADASVGHRMLLLGTEVVSIGIGSTSEYAAGRVQLSATGDQQDVAWPGTGYFPAELLPSSNRWSYQSATTDMSQATVTVTSPTGTLNTPVAYRAGKLLVWQMPQLPEATEAPTTYHVKIATSRNTIEYDVHVFAAKPKSAPEAVSDAVTPTSETATPSETPVTPTEPVPTVTVTETVTASATSSSTTAAPTPTVTISELATPEPTVTITELVSPQPTVTVTMTVQPAPVVVTPTAPRSQIYLKVNGLDRRGRYEMELGKDTQNLTVVATVQGRSRKPTFTISGQPRGVTIDKASGVISGTPQRSGTYRVKVTATANGVSTTEEFTWVVNSPAPKPPTPKTPEPTPKTLGPNDTGDTKTGPSPAPTRQREQRQTTPAPKPTQTKDAKRNR